MNPILLIVIIVSFTLGTILSFADFSFAQSILNEKQSSSDNNTFIFVQTYVRNSNGKIVAYLGSSQFTDIDSSNLEKLLNVEVNENDPIFSKDGKKFQVIKRALTVTYDRDNVIASTILASTHDGKVTMVARFAHDGYPIIEGDQVTTIWTFIRTIQQ